MRSGDTLYAVSRRTNAPLRALIDANNLHPPYALQAGQHLIVPRVRAYHVQPGDTLASVSHRYGIGASEIVQANALAPPYSLRTGEVLVLPPGPSGPVAAPAAVVVQQQARAPSPAYAAAVPPAPPNAAVETVHLAPPAPSVSPPPLPPPQASGPPGAIPVAPAGATHYDPAAVTPVPRGAVPLNGPPPPPPPPAVAAVIPGAAAALPPPPAPGAPVVAQPASLSVAEPPVAPEETLPTVHAGRFIWPVRGTIVSDFGSKPGGLQNDGINIAAPRGTPIRAADTGIVVYAGNELRGFGNLLLVKHPGGWVTAYAHAQEILVHRGQEVRRGQVVARVGSSGGVTAPQLHFEVRKGSHPLNPRDYLGPQTASASP